MADKVKMRLQGHEKFALREGWISKGLDILTNEPDAFLRKDAPDLFGIGSNMVKSLRYWMKAMGLISDKGLTKLGEIISKYDPYIEDVFSLWILHSNIAKNLEEATSWFMYFNRCDAEELEKSQINSILLREISLYANGQTFSEKSVGNDVDIILNMYSKRNDSSDPEEKNVSPFAQLGLVKFSDGKYKKNQPEKKRFDEDIVLYELSCNISGNDGVSIERVLDDEKGLKRIYNMSGVMANEYFDRLDASGYIRVDRTAGLDMIYPLRELAPLDIIKEYYESR